MMCMIFNHIYFVLPSWDDEIQCSIIPQFFVSLWKSDLLVCFFIVVSWCSQLIFEWEGLFSSLLKSMQFWAQITMKLQMPSSNTVTKYCGKRNHNMNAILRVSQLAMDSWIYSVKTYFRWYEACNLWFHSSNTKFILGFLICSTFQQVGGYTVTSIILTPFMNGSSIHDSIRWNFK